MTSLLDLYFGSDANKSGKVEPAPKSVGNVMDLYFSPNSEISAQTTNRVIAPPISGVDQATSDRLNAERASIPVQPSTGTNLPVAMERISRAPSEIGQAVNDIIPNIGSNIKQDFVAGAQLAASGLNDLSQRQYLPATPSLDPQTWSAGGLIKMPAGALGAIASPITGTVKELIEKPVASLTGSKEAGERAGFIANSAIPIVPAGSAVVARIPSNKAITDIVNNIGKDNIADVITQLKSNPRLTLMDVSEPIRQMAQKLATTEGRSIDTLKQRVEDRIATASRAVEDAFDTTLGPRIDVKQKLDELKQNVKNAGKDINPIIAAANPVDVSPILTHIDSILKPGVNQVVSIPSGLPTTEVKQALGQVRSLLANKRNMRTDPKDLHDIQSMLRAEADGMLNSPNPLDRKVGYAIMDVRNRLVKQIDEATGTVDPATGIGAYRQQLSKYRDENQVQDAFDKGYLIAKNRKGTWDDRPEFWADWVNNATDAEKNAAKQGARVAIDDMIRGMRNPRGQRGTEIIETEANREKLAALFGKKEFDELDKSLRDERNIYTTNTKLFDNSQTAMRMKANSAVDLPETRPFGQAALPAVIGEGVMYASTGTPFLGVGTMLGVGAVKKGYNVAQRQLALRKNNILADVISAPEGPTRQALIDELSKHIPAAKPSLLTRSNNALIGVIGTP